MANFGISLNHAAFDLAIAAIRVQAINEVKRVTNLTAQQMVTEAKLVVPVDTGMLRDSIKYVLIDDGMAAEISANTDYAAYVEFGTSRQRAQPYMVPSLEKVKPFYVDELTKALNNLGS